MIRMKHLMFVIVCISLAGCLPKKLLTPSQQPTQPMTPKLSPQAEVYYSGKTNGELILDSINDMPITIFDDGILKKGQDYILVASLDHPGDSEFDDFPMIRKDTLSTFVEDALTTRITQAGYYSVERDLDILTRLYHEVDKDYLISIRPDYKPEKILKELMALFEDKKDVADNPYAKMILDRFMNSFEASNLPYVRYPFKGGKPLQESDSLISAKYILSFRVLECGVSYRPAESENGALENVERVAISKFHLRLTNQKGVTIWSQITSGKATEINPAIALPYLQNTQLTFVGYTKEAERLMELYKPLDKTDSSDSKGTVPSVKRSLRDLFR